MMIEADYRKTPVEAVELSIGVLLGFFLWMVVPFGLIVAVWIELAGTFDTGHFLKSYPRVLQAEVGESPSLTESKPFKITQANVNLHNSRREPRHRLLTPDHPQAWNGFVTPGYADDMSSVFIDHGEIH